MQIILNADDFGRSTHINLAVVKAHREGVLTSASLMIAGEAAEEAIVLARENPSLAIGLHLTVTEGRAALPQSHIPHLVDAHGYFPRNAAWAGLRYALSRTLQRELIREVTAQFERFAATGLSLSHVDGHHHMHVHPSLLATVLSLAEQFGACGFRLPRDDFWLSVRHSRRQFGTKAAWALIFAALYRWCLRALCGHHLKVTHRTYGLLQSGQMEEAYVVRVLRELSVPTAELYFHPTFGPNAEPLGPNPGDLAALLSPAVRQIIEERSLRLTTYPALQEA
ncbi:MAG: hopanoid biosynthesis-associated protein HpnK [Anaerolineae bacterium]|nr:hopanoid biosynthesis-associated protein HpnK [Anaerolineae bacterium]MDW8101087.1 hopanoid biosynthesis-associated protein HpnK [Anaerolineae bacterium]